MTHWHDDSQVRESVAGKLPHENPDMSARYGRQVIEDVKYRKEWAQKVGLGFDLPQAEPPSAVNCATGPTNLVEHARAANAQIS
jgi:hypothetical protein